jgi:hypothetical protein
MKKIKVEIPKETMIAIDKAVRHRGREGYFGTDYSTVVGREEKND